MTRNRHPKKEVEKALQRAEELGWKVITPAGHWGRLLCSHENGCVFSISGSPKNEQNEAKRILRKVRRCPHNETESDEEDPETGQDVTGD